MADTCWRCGEELVEPDKEGTIGGDGHQLCLACDEEIDNG